ncbi:MAG: PadR family transcriptional regulator [Phycisphaerae bacterium]
MNGVPELLVLRHLAKERMYGYELVRAIRRSTGDVISLGEGVIYPTLHALEREGALSSRTTKVEGRPRVYYRITAKGRRRLEYVRADWSRITAAITGALRATDHAQPAL